MNSMRINELEERGIDDTVSIMTIFEDVKRD